MMPSTPPTSVPTRMRCSAPLAPRSIVLDAQSPDPLWQMAPRYAMSVPRSCAPDGDTLPREGGTVQFLWNESCLYLAADFADSDVIARGMQDGDMHYELGDLVELFLWPSDSPWYWELYGTPANLQTSLFFHPPQRTVAAEANITPQVKLEVSAWVDGTLNHTQDRDRGFRVEMAVPATELTRHGDAWGAGTPWRVLVGRYNYSRWLPATELSAMPALAIGNFHLREQYADLVLLPSNAD